MKRKNRLQTLVTACFLGSAFAGASSEAFAQAPPLSESIVIGGFTFRPSIEARIRGEYRRNDVRVDRFFGFLAPDAVLADAYQSNLPPQVTSSFVRPVAYDQWSISERVRLGIAVDRGPVTAVVKVQDARVLGGLGIDGQSGIGALGGLAANSFGLGLYEAYIDVHARSGRQMFLRLGRQAVKWGDGRLIGTNDFSATGRSLDAARAGFEAGDFDFEGLAVLLRPPLLGSVQYPTDTGAQLYGLHITGHFLPLLQAELTGLARIVRTEQSATLTPSDTFVADLRVSGEHRGFRYSLEGAYELGQVASYGKNRQIQAPAFAGRLEWETALPAHLTFGAQGAYASGDDGTSSADKAMTRFDPILPDVYENHGRMGLYAWSNLIEAGGDIGARPTDELSIGAGYRFVGLANPKGRWTTASLTTIGADPKNDSVILGHEIDATIKVTPWDPVTFQGGYGLFLPGDGGKAILRTSGHGSEANDLLHWAYLQVTVKAP